MKLNRILYLDNSDTIYTRSIRNELNAYAKKIDCYFYDEILQSPIFYKKFLPKENEKLWQTSINDFLSIILKWKYDLIIIKEPQIMPLYFFEKIKEKNKDIPIINYNWSSIKKFNVLPYLESFTHSFSFDYNDCQEYKFKYLPLFFLKEFESIRQEYNKKKYLLSFIGSGFSEGRIKFIENLLIKEAANLSDFYLYIYTPEKLNSLKLLLRNRTLAKYCYFNPLHMNGLLNALRQSHSTIDHPMRNQTGLTMRTFEALASGLHLYTTNTHIATEPFYVEERITIIRNDLSDLKIDLHTHSKTDSEYFASFQEYRIDNWMKKLLNQID